MTVCIGLNHCLKMLFKKKSLGETHDLRRNVLGELCANMMWKWETSYNSQENAGTEWACELISDFRAVGKVRFVAQL